MIYKFNINNTPVYFQESHNLPMIDIQINFKAGSIFDGKQHGLSDLLAGVFATKTKQYSEQDLINKITDCGISLNTYSNKEFFSIKIRLLNEDNIITNTLNILEEIFTNAIFDTTILEREKTQTLTHIDYLNKQPSYLASLELSKNLFKDSPYSHPTIGYKENIKSINTHDVTNFFNKYICANNANICIVGDIKQNQVENISNNIISFLAKGEQNTQKFSQKDNDELTIKKPFQSKQTTILIGHQLLISTEDKLFFPLKIGNEILGGGGLNSLLFNKVREELGLVYNISSVANINPDYGSFIISAQTSNPSLALKSINDVYKKFVNSIIDDKTLANFKRHIEGTHLLSSVKNSSKLNMLSVIANKNLPLDFFDNYVDNIYKVTSEEIHKAFSLIKNNKTITVMVGNFE
ncbi:MAG: pitrilysin family protein [Francisella sp.]